MESKLYALTDKLLHDLPQVRERALASIVSKIQVCGTKTVKCFPLEKLVDGLVRILETKPSSNITLEQCLWLMLELVTTHPAGHTELRSRGAIRLLEGIPPRKGPPLSTSPNDVLSAIRSYEGYLDRNLDSSSIHSSDTPLYSSIGGSCSSLIMSPIISKTFQAMTPISHNSGTQLPQTQQQIHNNDAVSSPFLAAIAGNLAYYHDGWRPATVSVDDSDLRRIADTERLLCTADATSKSDGCFAMTQVLLDMPVEVLLQRPHSLHAIAAAIKPPLSEYIHSSPAQTEKSQRGVFDVLLVAIIGTLETVASSLFLTVQRHTVDLVGGDSSRDNAMNALKEINGDNNALWKSISLRYPSPLHISSRAFTENPSASPDTSTPLAIGGTALLVIRACFSLIGISSMMRTSALNIVYQLLPLLTEENLPKSPYSDHSRDHALSMRALTVTRCAIVLRCYIDTFGYELSLNSLEAVDEERCVLPFLLLHFLVASSRVIPMSWLTSHSSPVNSDEPSLLLEEVIIDTIQQIALSATIRKTHPLIASDCSSVLSVLRPDCSDRLSQAIVLLQDAKPVNAIVARHFTDRHLWMEEWISSIASSLNNVLQFVVLREESKSVASNAIFMWAIVATSGALIKDVAHCATWNKKCGDLEMIMKDILLFEFSEEVGDVAIDFNTCYLRTAALDAFAAMLNGHLDCTVRRDLQVSGFELADLLDMPQLIDLLNSSIFSDMLLVAIDELSNIDADLEFVSNAAASIIAFVATNFTYFDAINWPCTNQLHLSLSLCQTHHLKGNDLRDKIADIDPVGYHLRSLFEDSSLVRLSAAQWLVKHSELPVTCLTESCRVARDFIACLRSHRDEETHESQFRDRFSGDRDIQQLVLLVQDDQLVDATRVAACSHLCYLIGDAIKSNSNWITEALTKDMVSDMVLAATCLSSPVMDISIENSCDKSGAALDLLLILLWGCPKVVRHMLLGTMGSSKATLFNNIIPWMFGAGCPHASLRRCAGKASLILWRLLFDPSEFMKSWSQDRDIYPIGLLIGFPSPPLNCLTPTSQHTISALLNKDKKESKVHLSNIWSADILVFLQSELRMLTGETRRSDADMMSWWCPVTSAGVLREKMAKSSSHVEFRNSIITAASRAIVDPLFLAAFASSNINQPVSWEKALLPLLSNIPNSARDYRLLQGALPLLLALLPHLKLQDHLFMASKILDVMVPLIKAESVRPEAGKSKSVSQLNRMDVPNAPPCTILSVRLSVLRLLKNLASCSGIVAISIITDPRLLSQLTEIISSPFNVTCELTKTETLLFVAAAVNSIRVLMTDCNALRSILPVLTGHCVSSLNLPRLPDSWNHKGIIRASMEAIVSLLTLCSNIDVIAKNDLLVSQAVAAAKHGAGRGRGLVHWCRRLCCDREAPVRAFSFATLTVLINSPRVWSLTDSEEEPWTVSGACIAASRVVADQSESPVVRAAAIDVISAELRQSGEVSTKCAMICCQIFVAVDSKAVTPCVAAASCRLVMVISASSSDHWERMVWESDIVAMLVLWVNPLWFGESTGACTASAAAAQALRLLLTVAVDTSSFATKLLESTDILENILYVLQCQLEESDMSLFQFAEVSMLLYDLLVSPSSSTITTLLTSNRDVAPIIVMNLAKVIGGTQQEEWGLIKQLNRAQSASVRLVCGILSSPEWSSVVGFHRSAVSCLWEAIVQVRLVGEPDMSTQASIQDSFYCHMALASVVHLKPKWFENNSVEYEDMTSKLCIELEGIFAASVIAKQEPRMPHSQSSSTHRFQHRLFLLRSLCECTPMNSDICWHLTSLVDRIWLLDMNHEDSGPSCEQLLIGIIGGMARNEATAKTMCSQRLSKHLCETSGCSTSGSLSSRATMRSEDSRNHSSAESSVKRLLTLLLSPLTKGNTPLEDSKLRVFVVGGMAWRSLVQCDEGRTLLTNSLCPMITLMHELLSTPRQRRREAKLRLVSLMQILVAATLHDQELKDTLFKTASFVDFISSVGERFHSEQSTAGFVGDDGSLCCMEIAELLALLIRNLAMLRANKAKLCATSSILKFLLFGISSQKPKLVSSASSALWAILHDCERAKSALRLLNAQDVIMNAKASLNLTQLNAPSYFDERSMRHLSMLIMLISQ